MYGLKFVKKNVKNTRTEPIYKSQLVWLYLNMLTYHPITTQKKEKDKKRGANKCHTAQKPKRNKKFFCWFFGLLVVICPSIKSQN